jgi:predicted dienelactone hydrolase
MASVVGMRDAVTRAARPVLVLATSLVVAAGIATPVAAAAPVVSTTAAPLLGLPAPTGPYRVGTTLLHLVDHARTDPLAPTPRPRELMVRLWYPAARGGQPAAYQTPGVSALYAGFLNAVTGANYPADLLAFPTHSRLDAPAAAGPRRPVALASPDAAGNAADLTALHEELASRGYVVAAIDHTFDAGVVEFPGGRLEVSPATPADTDLVRAVRTADARFVLDALATLAAGRNPDADHRALPHGLGRSLDLSRVAAVGHGLGGRTAVDVATADRRIDAAVLLDADPLATVSLRKPVLMFGDQGRRRADDPGWAAFYDGLRGPRLHLVLDGAGHDDLSDVAMFKATFGPSPFFETGPVDGARGVAVERAYVTAWLDRALRGRPSALLRHESPRYPEVDFQP